MGILGRIRRKKSDAARRPVSRMKDKEETSDSCADGACVWFGRDDWRLTGAIDFHYK